MKKPDSYLKQPFCLFYLDTRSQEVEQVSLGNIDRFQKKFRYRIRTGWYREIPKATARSLNRNCGRAIHKEWT